MNVTVEQLINNITEAYVEVDRELRILSMNSRAEELLRRERGVAIGATLEAVISDATRSQHWQSFVALVADGKNETISIFYPAQYRWHDVTVIPLSSGGTGLLMRDVTDRQWLIRREAERVYLRGVFEEVPIAITVMRGRKLEIEYMNAFARQVLNHRKVIGLPIREALPEIEQKELFDTLDRVCDTGIAFHARNVHIRFDRNNDGNLEDGYFDVSYHAIRDFDGTISGVLSISIEVSGQKS
jgi:PAS domain-containing protein